MSAMQGILMSDDNVKHECVELSHFLGGSAYVGSRQLTLEAQASTPASWSGWFIPSNNGMYFMRVMSVGLTAVSTAQMNLSFYNAGSVTVGAEQRLRLRINTNGANAISIQNQNLIPRNRAFHFVVTWNGVNAAGFDMYINGVKELSPTRVTDGTYTGPLNDSNLRFAISRIDGDKTRGNLRSFAKWGKKLSDAEVVEMFNGGKVKESNTLSFYADVIADWPLKTNTDCLNNATFNLGSPSNVSYTTRAFNVRGNNINFQKATITNTRYVGFGGFVKISPTIAYYYGRSGTSHIAGGKIVKFVIHLDTQVIDAPVDVITDGSYDIRGGCPALINGKIFWASARYDAGTFIDLGYHESTDGTTGETFGARQVLPTTLAGFQVYGDITEGFSAGEYFIPTSETDSSTQYIIALHKTSNYGVDLFGTKIIAYSGSTKLVEPSLINLGNNTLMIIARREGAPRGLLRIISTDGGTTWDTPVLTNMGGTVSESNARQVITDNGKLTVLFMDRGDGNLWASRSNNIATILASPTAFASPIRVANSYTSDGYNILGYAAIINLGNNKFLSAYSCESSSSVADLYVGFGELNNR